MNYTNMKLGINSNTEPNTPHRTCRPTFATPWETCCMSIAKVQTSLCLSVSLMSHTLFRVGAATKASGLGYLETAIQHMGRWGSNSAYKNNIRISLTKMCALHRCAAICHPSFFGKITLFINSLGTGCHTKRTVEIMQVL